jgi:hypothetical protein
MRQVKSVTGQNYLEGMAMEKTKTYTLAEAHTHFAKSINGEVWELLQKPERTQAEEERMLYAAYASGYHWLQTGSGLTQQRSEWLISHVYCVLDLPSEALRHARRCLELTNQYADMMEDFDRAYAYESMARAIALAGHREEAARFLQLAEMAGRAIREEEDRRIFLRDINSGNWNGVK